MNRSIVGGVATTMLALVAVFGGAASAQADDGSDCTRTRVCVWENQDYWENMNGSGFRGMTQSDQYYSETSWSDNSAPNINDKVSSVKSYGASCRVRFFTDEKYGGSSIYFKRVADGYNYEDPMLSDGGGTGSASGQNWDDRISSHQFVDCV